MDNAEVARKINLSYPDEWMSVNRFPNGLLDPLLEIENKMGKYCLCSKDDPNQSPHLIIMSCYPVGEILSLFEKAKSDGIGEWDILAHVFKTLTGREYDESIY